MRFAWLAHRLAPALKFFFAVPVSDFCAKPGTGKLARGEQDMDMDVTDIAFAAWRVDGEVGDHAPADELLADKIAHQLQVLLEGQFVGKGYIE